MDPSVCCSRADGLGRVFALICVCRRRRATCMQIDVARTCQHRSGASLVRAVFELVRCEPEEVSPSSSFLLFDAHSICSAPKKQLSVDEPKRVHSFALKGKSGHWVRASVFIPSRLGGPLLARSLLLHHFSCSQLLRHNCFLEPIN